MRTIAYSKEIRLPKKVSSKINGRIIEVKGPRGILKQDFSNMQILIEKRAKKIIKVSVYFTNRRTSEYLGTTCSLISNMIKGVTDGFRYKMRLVYAHYPILFNKNPQGNQVSLKNFYGQKNINVIDYPEGVNVYPSGNKDEIIVEGIDLRLVSLTAARLHQTLDPQGKDVRKFLDGIYVTEKTTLEN